MKLLLNGSFGSSFQELWGCRKIFKWYSSRFLTFSFSQNLALKTLLNAFTENKNLPSLLMFFHTPFSSTPPPGTMQCTCGCKLSCCPQVCKTAIIPICICLFFPNVWSVSQAVSNKVSYSIFGSWSAVLLTLLFDKIDQYFFHSLAIE